MVASLVVLAVNNRFGKARWPGSVTGIASDVSGLVLLPVIVACLVDLMRSRSLGWQLVAVIATVVAAGFAAVELVAAAGFVYEHVIGVGGAPLRAATGSGWTRTVAATRDPFDLFAVPFTAVGPLLWARAETNRRLSSPAELGSVEVT